MSEEYGRNEAGDETMDVLPDVPDADPDSTPITSPNPIDFSTTGITAAGAAGMSTFNDGDDRGLFERTVDVFEEGNLESPFMGEAGAGPASTRRARIYGSTS